MNSSPGPAASILKHSTIYAIGNISRQLISFIMLPVYTHYLTPADYGVVGLISFAIAIFETLFGAKLVSAVPKFYHDQSSEEARNMVVSTAFIVTGAVSSITVAFLVLFRDVGSSVLFGSDRFGLIVGLCATQMLTQALEYYGLMHMRLLNRPLEFVGVNLAKLAVQLSLNIWLVVYWRLGILGVAISGLAATSLFAIAVSIRSFLQTGWQFDAAMAKRMVLFSWPLWISGLASLYIYSSNRYYIRIFDSLANVGLFELAAKFSGILGLLIWAPFSQYWQTEQFRLFHRSDANELFQSVFRVVSYLLIAVALGISIFSDPVIRIMSAPSFYGATTVVPLLLLTSVLMCLTEFENVSFLANEKTLWLSKNNFIVAILATVLYVGLIPILGFIGAAIALCLAQICQFLMIHFAARSNGNIRISLKPLLQMTSVAGAGYILANYVFAQSNIWLDVPIKAIIYITTGIALTFILFSDPASKERLLIMLAPVIARLQRRRTPAQSSGL